MAPKAQKSKEAKLLAAQSASKGKGKKKWSKGKVREKKNYRVVFNAELLAKMIKEVPRKMKVVTTYSLVEAYKINGSLARRSIKELLAKDLIKPVLSHHAAGIWQSTVDPKKLKAEQAAADAEATKKKPSGAPKTGAGVKSADLKKGKAEEEDSKDE